ncbi:hypothetical protein TUMEXPCC7403_22840 [Tumidithrix helvetica PCC 7403]|uniref:DUF928 domain-containing protein n=1 Tax=Tumidithrix helvetica TaxID=3457545 RepID=UPI003CB67E92
MFTFKQPIKSLRPALILGTLCLATLVGTVVLTSTVEAQRGQSFGLGMSSSSTTAGATRGTLPPVLLLVPPDGARTLSARPTLYWYVSPTESQTKQPFQTRFFLRETPLADSKALFDVKGTAQELGLYKFKLPDSAPSLVAGKVQRLHLRWTVGENVLNLNAPVLLEVNPSVVKAVSEASSGLEKARILAKELYWYDALDAYTKWLETNPKDETAIKERNALLLEGFKSSELKAEVVDELLCKLTRNSTTHQMELK